MTGRGGIEHRDLPRTLDVEHPPHRLLRAVRPRRPAAFRRRYDVQRARHRARAAARGR